jgi:para-nitrobenzyl esterase
MDLTAKPSDKSPPTVIRECRAGAVEGRVEQGICRFFSVPYAAPPVGENRFREPQPVESWSGVRNTTSPGPSAFYQIFDFPSINIVPLVGTGGTGGDDFLTLNIWAPEDARNCPVMVWVHGGAFVLGSKDARSHDGSEFARSGVVCVAINYRLGIDGFLPIPDVPTNLGLRDIIAALRWVQENIGAFGGDPTNVTIFGESAGAMATADLVTSPLVKGLFRRAIIQSGHGAMVRDIPTAQRLVRKLARLLKITPDVRGFRGVDAERGWRAMEKLGKPLTRLDLRDAEGHEPVFGISRFIPVWGDDVLPEKPLEALRSGAGADIDVLIGTNAEEMNFYFVPTGVKRKLPGWLARWLLGKSHPRARDTLKAYGSGQKGKTPGAVFADAMTDLVFRWPARRFAEEHRGRTHVYEFDWRSPRFDNELGASHGMEVPFVFKTLPSVTGATGLVGENPPPELAERIHRIWVQFATDGSLPWPEFDRDNRAVRLLFADETISEPPMPAAAFLP